MKSIVIFCFSWLVFVGFGTLADRTLSVSIKEGSHFYIKGTSNVNSFTCEYDKLIQPQRFYLSYNNHKEGWLLKNSKLAFESSSFDCGGRRINKDFKDLIKADDFKAIEIKVREIQTRGKHLEATVQISIAGKTHVSHVKVKKDDKESKFTSDFKLDIEDFNLESPTKMMGLIKVDNEIEVHVSLVLSIDS